MDIYFILEHLTQFMSYLCSNGLPGLIWTNGRSLEYGGGGGWDLAKEWQNWVHEHLSRFGRKDLLNHSYHLSIINLNYSQVKTPSRSPLQTTLSSVHPYSSGHLPLPENWSHRTLSSHPLLKFTDILEP